MRTTFEIFLTRVGPRDDPETLEGVNDPEALLVEVVRGLAADEGSTGRELGCPRPMFTDLDGRALPNESGTMPPEP